MAALIPLGSHVGESCVPNLLTRGFNVFKQLFFGLSMDA